MESGTVILNYRFPDFRVADLQSALFLMFFSICGVSEPREHDYQYPENSKDAIDGSILNSLHGYRLEHDTSLSLHKHLLGVRKVTTNSLPRICPQIQYNWHKFTDV